jgi:hypothetical protein
MYSEQEDTLTMTIQPSHTHPNNTAILVGQLGTVADYRRGGGKVDAPIARRFTQSGGEFYLFALQLETPSGEPFVFRMQITASTPGFEFLSSCQPGDWVAVEGMAQYVTITDRRYAQSDEDEGRNVRDMQLQVALARAPRADEPRPASAAWLEGKVAEPPRFLWLPGARSIQLALTTLEVFVDREMAGRPSYPGLRRIYRDRIEVPLAIPVDHEQAGLLFNAGNGVRVDGEVSQVMLPQFGPSVTAAVEKLNKEWEARKAYLEGRTRQEQEIGLRRYRKQLEQLTTQARMLIMTSFVEPIGDAQPISYNQARTARREFARLRQRGAAGAPTQAQPNADAPEPLDEAQQPLPQG